MHASVEALRRFGFTSEPDLLDIEKFDKKKVIRFYEQLYSAVHEAQKGLPEPEESSIDPFTFTASASMRAGSTCWEWQCRLQKLDFLARYSALYANRVIVPLSLRHPDHIKDVSWARQLLTHSGLTLLQLRLLIDEGIVTPVVMVTSHCEHVQPWVDEMVRLTHTVSDRVAADFARKFRTVYQTPEKSPTGRSTIYVDGPEDFLEHGSLVELFDEHEGWRPKSWAFNRLGRREITGPRKIAVLRRIFGQIATDTTFYLAFGRGHTGRYLTDRRGEAFLLELLTDDKEVTASSAVLSAHMSHAVPLLGDLPLSTLIRVRKQERDSFARYRAAIERIFGEVLKQKGHVRAHDAREIFKLNIQPQLLKMKSELRQEQRRQKRRIAGGLAALAASVGLGAFGSIVPLLAKAAAVGASAMVGGRLLSKAAEAKCEHGATLKERNDFYFLLRLAEESERG